MVGSSLELNVAVMVSNEGEDSYGTVISFYYPAGLSYRRTLAIQVNSSLGLRLNLNIKKTKIMASGPNTSCEIDGETVETVSDFIFLGSKITADGPAAMKLKDAYSLEGKL